MVLNKGGAPIKYDDEYHRVQRERMRKYRARKRKEAMSKTPTKNIEIHQEAYERLLQLKNHVVIKTRYVTNPDVDIDNLTDMITKEYDPEYTWTEFITQIVEMIWLEQQSGEVLAIT